MRKLSLVLPLAAVIGACASMAHSSETKTLKAHEHGVGKLNIAFEHSQVMMELEAPGADIVGFEHPAESPEDKASVRTALNLLEKPLALFVFPKEAKCTVAMATAELHGEEGDHEKEHGHGHDEKHADAHHGEGAKNKEKKEHHHEHKEHAKHDKDEDDHDGASHTEFHAEYRLNCGDIGAIDEIKFVYFATFPNAGELDIQLISDRGAHGLEVERDDPALSLAGRI